MGWVSLGSKVPPAPSRLGSAGRGFLGFTAKQHSWAEVRGKRCVPATAWFQNKASTHSSYLIPRDSPLSVLRVPAPIPYP